MIFLLKSVKMGSCCSRKSELVQNPDPVTNTEYERNFTFKKIQTNINIIPPSPDISSLYEDCRSEPISFVSITRQPRASTVKHRNLFDLTKPNFHTSNTFRSEGVLPSVNRSVLSLSGLKIPVRLISSPNETESELNSLDSDNSQSFNSQFSRLELSHSFFRGESGFSRSSNRSPSVPHTLTMSKSKSLQGKRKINQYTIEKQIGRGAFGVVFKAISDDGKISAIKVYNKRVLRSKWIGKRRTAMDSVKVEIEIMKTLEHDNIIRLLEVIDVETSKKIYLVIELAEKGSLYDMCPVDEDKCKKYFWQLMVALDYLHNEKFVVHRDIKPQNLLLSKNDDLKVCDFGGAQFIEEQTDELNNSAGTFVFLPPEAHKNGGFRGKPADIWACALTLYFMVAGKSPYQNKQYAAIIQEMSETEIVFPETFSVLLKDLLKQMTDKDPNKRIEAKEVLNHPWFKKKPN